jgi:hypothetical protein
MNTPQVRRKLQKSFDRKQDKYPAIPGVLGNADGIVEVPGIPTNVYVTISDNVIIVYARSSIQRIPGLPVLVGYDQDQPTFMQVLTVRQTDVELVYYDNNVSNHHTQHEWPEYDTVYTNIRQILPLRISTSSAFNVSIYPGVVWCDNTLLIIATATFDLSAQVPITTNKARLVWFTINTAGTIVQTNGAEVDTEDLDNTVLPTFPTDTQFIIGAVRLFYGQQVLSDAITGTDILDLRMPMWHTHNLALIGIHSNGFRLTSSGTSWDDMRIAGSSIRSGVTAPTLGTFGPSGSLRVWRFESGKHQECEFEIQMPHNWKEGSRIYPHVHWTPVSATAGNVVWELEYSWANIGGTFGAPGNMANTAQAAGGTAWVHKLAPLLEGGNDYIDGTGKTISSMLVMRLHRNAGSGGDTLAADVALLEFDIHYEIDSFGSDLPTQKTA